MAVKKSKNQIKQDFANKLEQAGAYWIESQPADMGNYAGVVEVPNTENMVYVRLANGQVIQAFNNLAPNIYNWKVVVGRDKSNPWLIKIIEVRWIYNIRNTVAYILFHHKQHEYPAPDTVWVRRDQFMPLLVLPKGGFHVRLFGDTIYSAGMSAPVRVADEDDIDLSSYSGGTEAFYVLLEADGTGALNYIEGAHYGSLALLYLQPLPKPSNNAFPICAFIFHEGQTELRRDSEVRTIIDLRMFTSDATTGLVLYLDDLFDVDTPSPNDGQVLTWSEYAGAWIASDSAGAQFLDELLDVDTPSPSDGQVLTYNAYAGVWIASSPQTIGQYRQFVYEVSGGDFTFVIDEDGNPVMALEDLE